MSTDKTERRAGKGRPSDEGRLIQVVYYVYVFLSAVARAIPERISYGLAQTLGGFAARISKKRGQTARNIARITGRPPGSPEVERLVKEAYRSYARYWLETFALVREGRDFFLERFRATGEDNLDGVLARGKGALVVVGHLGNWDAAGAWAGARGNRLATVAEVLRPRRMFDFFVEHRASLGMKIYPAQAGATRSLAAEIERGSVVAILGDRDLKGTGVPVTFFGEEATMPPGPATIALKTGVPLLVAGVYGDRLPDGRRGWTADISEPIELPDDPGEDAVAVLTQRVAERLEEFVRRRPEEWHVLQPFWSADRRESEGR